MIKECKTTVTIKFNVKLFRKHIHFAKSRMVKYYPGPDKIRILTLTVGQK